MFPKSTRKRSHESRLPSLDLIRSIRRRQKSFQYWLGASEKSKLTITARRCVKSIIRWWTVHSAGDRVRGGIAASRGDRDMDKEKAKKKKKKKNKKRLLGKTIPRRWRAKGVKSTGLFFGPGRFAFSVVVGSVRLARRRVHCSRRPRQFVEIRSESFYVRHAARRDPLPCAHNASTLPATTFAPLSLSLSLSPLNLLRAETPLEFHRRLWNCITPWNGTNRELKICVNGHFYRLRRYTSHIYIYQ